MKRRHARLGVALALATTACGGLAPPEEEELYVELLPGAAEPVMLQRFPEETDKEAVYALKRTLLGAEPSASERFQEMSGASGAEPAELDPKDPPSILYVPLSPAAREVTACYLGHNAFPVQRVGHPAEIMHHLRLLVVNKEPRPLRVPIAALRCLDEDGAALELVALGDDDGFALEDLSVGPGEELLAHAFLRGVGLDLRLEVRWQVEVLPPGDEAQDAGAPGPWAFSAALSRRYVRRPGAFTPLEARVAAGELPLPRRARRPPPWREPHLEPVPPPPAPADGGD